MKIVGIIFVVLALAIAGVVAYLSKHGLFYSVSISEQNKGPYLLVYKKHIGDYKDAGKITNEIYYDLLNNHGLETTKGFGLYYDNPQQVEKEKLRSIAGCIIEGKSIEELEAIAAKYAIKEYPASQSVVASFPNKGMVSIILGVFKVYPKLGAYIENNNYTAVPIMEVYDQPNQKTDYISSITMPVEEFESF